MFVFFFFLYVGITNFFIFSLFILQANLDTESISISSAVSSSAEPPPTQGHPRRSKFDKAAEFLSDLMDREAVSQMVEDHELIVEYLNVLLKEPNISVPERLVWVDDIVINEDKVEYSLQVLSMLLLSSSTTDRQVCCFFHCLLFLKKIVVL